MPVVPFGPARRPQEAEGPPAPPGVWTLEWGSLPAYVQTTLEYVRYWMHRPHAFEPCQSSIECEACFKCAEPADAPVHVRTDNDGRSAT